MSGRVLIAGAGPVGLSLAASLTHQGIDVDVFEGLPELSTEARASTLHASTLEMFEAWGVADEVVAQGRKVETLQYWEREGRTLVAELPYRWIAEDTAYPFRLQCPQSWVTRILAPHIEATGHGRVHLGQRVVGHEDLGDRVRVHLETAKGIEHVEGDYLVGCDGAASRVREALGMQLEGKTYEDRFLLIGSDIDLRDEFDGIGDVAYIYDPAEWVIVMRLPHLVRTVFRLRPEEDAEEARDEASVRARLRAWLGVDPRCEIEMTSIYRVHQRVAECFRAGRVLLAGDAAHINNPAGGMGMNSGIHDAFHLGQALGRVIAGEADAALDDYADARRRAAVEMIQQSSDRNYRDLVLRDPNERRRRNERMRALAADPAQGRAYLLRAALLEERIG